MDTEALITEKIKAQALLPLFYHNAVDVCQAVVQALYDGGVRSVEFTNRGAKALDNFKALVQVRDVRWPGLLLGMGTIRERNEASRFIDAGADFLVSPFFDSGVCDAAYLNKTVWIPGCMTPSEIHVAAQAGCSFIKLFPGNTLGPGFVTAIKPLFPGIDFMVTGGVEATAENIGGWFTAGAAVLGMGSKLIGTAVLENGNYEKLKQDTAFILNIIQQVKV
jgi:2-dehydro-3-deoxyphosphogluconate aldolase / (4S)-4-hydroxy-2-oxoglutarate aldolase